MERLELQVGIIALSSRVAAAQTPRELPECAMNCLLKITTEPAFSNLTQEQLCHNEMFSATVGKCLSQACTAMETLRTANISASECGLPIRNDGAALQISSWTIFSLAMIFLALRFGWKYFERSHWGLDDIFMLLSIVFLIAQAVLIQLMVEHGVGRDVWTLSHGEIVTSFKLFFFEQLNYFLLLGLVKASILAFYLRIFPDHKFRVTVWLTQIVNLGSTLVCPIVMLTSKTPVQSNWESWQNMYPYGRVRTQELLFLTHGIFSIALDVWMVIIPITQLYYLGLKIRKKIGVISMFSVGVFLIICSVMRFIYLRSFLSAHQGTENHALIALIWACIEPCVGVMVGCSPNIRQFLRKVRSSSTGQSNLSGAQYHSSTGIFKNRSLELISDGTTAVESERSRDKSFSGCQCWQ